MIEIEVHIIGDVEIEEAIVVIITEGGACAPSSGISHASFRRDISERAITIVAIEHCTIYISNVEIFPAVIVEVADGGAKAPTAVPYPCFRADIGEGAIVIIPVELAGVAFVRMKILQRGTVDQEDIHPAVVVVVENCNAAAHGFHDVTLFRAAAG